MIRRDMERHETELMQEGILAGFCDLLINCNKMIHQNE